MSRVYDFACRALEAAFWLSVACVWVLLAIVGVHALITVVLFVGFWLHGVMA
jgi:hypothetical protein